MYGPHSDTNKKKMWLSLEKLVGDEDTSSVICGDFKEVRDETKRMICEFIERRAKWFKEFINTTKLINVPMMIAPIVLRDKSIDFGSKPTKIFDEWLDLDGVANVINEAWSQCQEGRRMDLADWENEAEKRQLTCNEREQWLDTRRKWIEKDKIKTNMMKQKSRAKWITEGDENTKFFHASMRRRYNKRNIQGLIINGEWNEDPIDIKNAVANHYMTLFKKQTSSNSKMKLLNELNICATKQITAEQNGLLECMFTESEVVDAIRECCNSKALGPDCFKLKFFKLHWELVKHDIVKALKWFWDKYEISNGCFHDPFICNINDS
ncbi:uncharacterized protein [Rutidosis leptorrhynchoides]|uniref:uncharacterized protein n=1 Tax=Rutidosis leptorrhynchoides TaxID=125765 RepID=UPI003A994DFA